jgi:hypothetical protein
VDAATEVERRVLLIDEFLEEITVLPDYIDVKVHGAPPLHVLYQEVGAQGLGVCACRRGDLNPHALAGTSPSSWRVCLFRHSDGRLAEISVQ